MKKYGEETYFEALLNMYYICELNHDQGSFTLGMMEGAKNIRGATFCFSGVNFNLYGDERENVLCFCWKGGSWV